MIPGPVHCFWAGFVELMACACKGVNVREAIEIAQASHYGFQIDAELIYTLSERMRLAGGLDVVVLRISVRISLPER